jgi:hypothetical protein
MPVRRYLLPAKTNLAISLPYSQWEAGNINSNILPKQKQYLAHAKKPRVNVLKPRITPLNVLKPRIGASRQAIVGGAFLVVVAVDRPSLPLVREAQGGQLREALRARSAGHDFHIRYLRH